MLVFYVHVRQASMKNILLVDDEKDLLSVLSKILARAGYAVETAVDGKMGLEKFRKKPPDLVITDLRMPGIGGAEMLHQMEQEVPEIKVAIVTGYPLDPPIQEKVNQGRYLWFSKPFDNTSLVEKVRGLLA